MTREKTDTILKVLVKHFFIEKEVTSTLVMDSLYTGLKALEYKSKNQVGLSKLTETDARSTSMVLVEQDMFVLADDVLILLERATLDTLPHQQLPTKDEKASQNRTKVRILLFYQLVQVIGYWLQMFSFHLQRLNLEHLFHTIHFITIRCLILRLCSTN